MESRPPIADPRRRLHRTVPADSSNHLLRLMVQCDRKMLQEFLEESSVVKGTVLCDSGDDAG